MFGPDYKAGCPSCSAIADGFERIVVHLANHDVALSAVSRAPLAKLQAYKQRMGWNVSLASSLGGDFNFDFNVSLTEEQQRAGTVDYNYRREGGLAVTRRRGARDTPRETPDGPSKGAAMTGTDVATYGARAAGPERVRARGRHRLSQLFDLCARAGRPLGRYQWLDRAPRAQRDPATGGIATTNTPRAEARRRYWWHCHHDTANAELQAPALSSGRLRRDVEARSAMHDEFRHRASESAPADTGSACPARPLQSEATTHCSRA